RRPRSLRQGHEGGGSVHPGTLFKRCPGLRTSGDGVLQLGRRSGAALRAEHAGESSGTEFLAAAERSSREDSAGNLRLRFLYRVGGGDWGESAAAWIWV